MADIQAIYLDKDYITELADYASIGRIIDRAAYALQVMGTERTTVSRLRAMRDALEAVGVACANCVLEEAEWAQAIAETEASKAPDRTRPICLHNKELVVAGIEDTSSHRAFICKMCGEVIWLALGFAYLYDKERSNADTKQ